MYAYVTIRHAFLDPTKTLHHPLDGLSLYVKVKSSESKSRKACFVLRKVSPSRIKPFT